MESRTFAKPRRLNVESAIYGIATGEENALQALYEQTSAAIYAYALTVTKNVYDAQDVTHDTFVKVYEAAPNYTPQGKPMSWILRITRNLCYDKFRKQSRETELTDEQLALQLSENDVNVTDRMVLKGCLLKLDDEERSVVVMHAVGGLKHREIAAELNLPLNTVLSKYNRALNKLKEILKGETS